MTVIKRNTLQPRDAARSATRILLAAVVAVLAACAPPEAPEPPIESIKYGHVTSPDGSVEAFACEYGDSTDGMTQVVLMFAPQKCGGGSYSAQRAGLELELEWQDDDVLIVYHPADVQLNDPQHKETIQCYDRKVRVEPRPR